MKIINKRKILNRYIRMLLCDYDDNLKKLQKQRKDIAIILSFDSLNKDSELLFISF